MADRFAKRPIFERCNQHASSLKENSTKVHIFDKQNILISRRSNYIRLLKQHNIRNQSIDQEYTQLDKKNKLRQNNQRLTAAIMQPRPWTHLNYEIGSVSAILQKGNTRVKSTSSLHIHFYIMIWKVDTQNC
jgi:hypothetical protein